MKCPTCGRNCTKFRFAVYTSEGKIKKVVGVCPKHGDVWAKDWDETTIELLTQVDPYSVKQ